MEDPTAEELAANNLEVVEHQLLNEFRTTHMGEIDLEYVRLVSEAGLYGQAFFGHRKTSPQARKLRHLWQSANRNILKKYKQEHLEVEQS